MFRPSPYVISATACGSPTTLDGTVPAFRVPEGNEVPHRGRSCGAREARRLHLLRHGRDTRKVVHHGGAVRPEKARRLTSGTLYHVRDSRGSSSCCPIAQAWPRLRRKARPAGGHDSDGRRICPFVRSWLEMRDISAPRGICSLLSGGAARRFGRERSSKVLASRDRERRFFDPINQEKHRPGMDVWIGSAYYCFLGCMIIPRNVVLQAYLMGMRPSCVAASFNLCTVFQFLLNHSFQFKKFS